MVEPVVCIVTGGFPPAYTGAGLRALNLARRLVGQHEVPVAVVCRQTQAAPPTETLDGVRVHRLALRFDPRRGGLTVAGYVAESAIRLYRALAGMQPPCAILHAFVPDWFALLALPAGRRLEARTLMELTMQGGLTNVVGRPGLAAWPINQTRGWLLRHADVVVSRSPATSDEYRVLGLPDERLVEVPNAVDTGRFAPVTPAVRARLRAALGIQPDQQVVLYVGGINARKGVDWLFDTFVHVATQHPQALLYLVGPSKPQDRPFYEALRQRVAASPVADRVRFTGRAVSDVERYMGAADLFTLASTREGFPNAVIEAMACGLPVVVRNIPGISDYQIQDGVDGIIVRENDLQAFATVLSRLLDDPAERAHLGQNARQTARRRFSTAVVDQIYLDLYQRLLSQ